MTQTSKPSSWTRRLLPAVLVGFLAIPCFLLLYVRVFPSGIQQRVSSPDGQAVAEQILLRPLTTLDTVQTTVQLRTKLNPFRHTVFAGLNYGAEVTISWIDSRNLLVKCVKCTNLNVLRREDNWRYVTIHYEIP
jgi:hypothetical protein